MYVNYQYFCYFSEIVLGFLFLHMGERGSPKSAKCFLRSLWMAPASVDLPNDFPYPSMQHLGEDLVTVLDQLRIKYCIGLGDGAGSNIIGKTFL